MVSQDATASRQDGLCFVVTMRVYTFIIIMIMNGRLEWNVHENTRKWWYSLGGGGGGVGTLLNERCSLSSWSFGICSFRSDQCHESDEMSLTSCWGILVGLSDRRVWIG